MADYNINAVTRRTVLSGSAGTGPYAFTFEVLDSDDVAVYKNATKLTITTDYTVTVNANGTGEVNLVTAATSSDNITIIGARDIERTTDFVTAGALKASALNEQLDGQIIMIQQLAEENKRMLTAPVEDPEHVDDGGTLNMVMPAKDDRKGKYLTFNETTGNPEAGPDTDNVNTLAAITDDIATLADIEDGTDATDAIQTVAGVSANVTTVAGISGNVSTVAGISSDITTVAGDEADIGTVAGSISNVNTVAGIDSDITTVAGISANVTTVAGDSADIQALAAKTTELGLLGTADAVADMNTLATSAIVTDMDALSDLATEIDALGDVTSDITTVAGIEANVTTVAGISANTTTVAGISGNITTVAGISSDVTSVAGISANTTTVAGISSDVTSVAGISSDVSTVSGISANVTTVAGDSADIATVAGDTTNIGTVAGDSANIGTVAGAISNVNLVGGSIANVNTVASNLADVNSFADTYFISASEPSSPTEGDLWFDTTNDIMKVYDGSGFVNAGSSVNGTANRESYVVGTSEGSYDGSTTVFPATYDAGYIDVYLNGVKLTEDDFTATNGTSITLDDAATSGDSLDIIAYGTFELLNLDISNDSSPTLGGDLSTNGNDINFGDNDKAQFGAGNDLQIYHNGNNSIVQDSGTGNLQFVANNIDVLSSTFENVAKFNENSDVKLYYDNAEKLATTSTGVDVTGTITADSFNGTGSVDFNNGTHEVGFGTGAIAGNGASNDAVIDLGRSNRRFKDLYLSGGAYLGGTASANHLDDYEEGTWTPVFADAASGGNTSSTTALTAKYIKVGGLVHVSFRMNDINTTGLTSNNSAFIQGLPFSPNQESIGSLWAQSMNTHATTVYIVSRVFGGSSYIRFENVRDNTSDYTQTVGDFNDDSCDMTVSVTYTTDS